MIESIEKTKEILILNGHYSPQDSVKIFDLPNFSQSICIIFALSVPFGVISAAQLKPAHLISQLSTPATLDASKIGLTFSTHSS